MNLHKLNREYDELTKRAIEHNVHMGYLVTNPEYALRKRVPIERKRKDKE